MTVKKHSANPTDLKAVLSEDRDLMKSLMQEALPEVLEAEMTELLGAGPHEREAGRQGYRAGHYERGLVTRIGKLELRVSRDRAGQFQTALFERYQRSEKAFVAALPEMYGRGCQPARSRPSPKSSAVTSSLRLVSATSTRGPMPPSPTSLIGAWKSPIPTSFSMPAMRRCAKHA